ncbi:MAG: hypothetical protein JWN67_4457 [Actinomycetia bacterium]|nr:hypothetical protein [Actinomycetes bacterium]
MIDAPAAAPPRPPGALGKAAPRRDVLTYLGALTRWRDQVHITLEQLDARSRSATDPDALAGDVTLAFALWQAVTTRVDELVTTWDSGRVGDPELESIARLTWGRLNQQLDAGLALTFPEACTLLDSQVERLTERLEDDALARAGVGDVLGPLGDRLTRVAHLAAQLGEHVEEVGALRARYDRALERGRGGADVGPELAAIAAAVGPLDRVLSADHELERSITRDQAALATRLERAGQAEAEARVLARRCIEKVVGAPNLAVPAVSVLGPVPTGGDRPTRRAALDAFAPRLDQVERALAEVRRRYAEPLDVRTELRGLLDAYHQMAGRHGLAEDADLAARHGAARVVLWQAPCDLDEARRLLDAYRDEVHRRTAAPDPDQEG